MLCVMLVPLACAVGAATAATFQRTASFYDKLQCRGDAADAGASDNVIHNVRGIAVPRLSLDSTDIKTIYLPGDLMVATRRRGSYTTTGSSSSMGTTSVGQSANTSTGVWSGASGTELPDDNSHDVVCAPHLQLAGPDLGERLFYARHVLRTVAADLLVWPYNVEQCGRQNLPLYVSAWTSLMPHREIVVAVLDRAFAMDNSRDDLKLMLEHVHQPDKYPAGVPQVYRKLVASLAGRGDSGSERTASLLFLSSEQSNFPSVGNWTQLDAFVQSELVAALQSGHTVGRVPFARDCTFAPGRDEDTADAQSMNNFSKTSVLFVSVSFIILMIISLAWLVFYYVQRFRYAHAKDRLARRLFNAARKALTKIPTRVVRAGDADLDTDCPVCIDPYAVGDMVRSLPCRHVFHKTCVDPWLLEHRTCPMCKMDILKAFGYTCSRAATCGNSPGAAGGAASPAGVLGSASSQDNDEIIDDDDDDEELEDDSAAAQPAQRRHSQRPRSRHNSATNSDSYHRDLSYPNSAAEHTEGRHPPRERHPFNDGRDNVAVVHQVLTEQTATGFNIIPLTVHGEPEGQRRRNSTSSRQGNESRCRSLASACHSSSQRQHAAKGAGRASSANASAPAACSRPWAATSGAPVELAVLQHQSVAEVHHPPQADASPASPKSDGRRSPDALIPHAEAYHSASCTPHLSERRQCLQSGGGAGPQQPASSGRHVLVSAARRPATALPPEYGAVLVKVAPRNGAHAEGRNELGGQAGGRPRTNSRSFSAKLRRSQDAGGEASIDQAANHMQMDVLSAS